MEYTDPFKISDGSGTRIGLGFWVTRAKTNPENRFNLLFLFIFPKKFFPLYVWHSEKSLKIDKSWNKERSKKHAAKLSSSPTLSQKKPQNSGIPDPSLMTFILISSNLRMNQLN